MDWRAPVDETGAVNPNETDAPPISLPLNVSLALIGPVQLVGLSVLVLRADHLDAALSGPGRLLARLVGMGADGLLLTRTLADQSFTLDAGPMLCWALPLAVALLLGAARVPEHFATLRQMWRGGGCGSLLLGLGLTASLIWCGIWALWLGRELPESDGRIGELYADLHRIDLTAAIGSLLLVFWTGLTFPARAAGRLVPRVLAGVVLAASLVGGPLAVWHGLWLDFTGRAPLLLPSGCSRLHPGLTCEPAVQLAELDLQGGTDWLGRDLPVETREPGWRGWQASAEPVVAAGGSAEATVTLRAARPLMAVERAVSIPIGRRDPSPWLALEPGNVWVFQRTVHATRGAVMWGLVRGEKSRPEVSDFQLTVAPDVHDEAGLYELVVRASGAGIPQTDYRVHAFDGETLARTESGDFEHFVELGDPIEVRSHDPLAGRSLRWCRLAVLPDHLCRCATGPIDAARQLGGPISCSRHTDGLKVIGALFTGMLTMGLVVPPVELEDIAVVYSAREGG